MAECIQSLEVCQTAREKQEYAFNLTPDFAIVWETDRPAPAVVRAIAESGKPGTGLEYASDGGQTNGKKEPAWPTELGAEPIVDGSATWTPQALSFDSLKHRIASCVWDVVAGITLSDQVETDLAGLQEVRITVSGGTARTVYTCPGLITTVGGKKFEVRLIVTIDE